jgi:hypothetical protein
MKKLSHYIMAATLFLLVSACKKELEKTPFKLTTNEVMIQLDSTNFNVVTLDTLRVNATITETKPQGHPFSYSWQVWPNIGEGEMQEISKEKNLKVKILLAPNSYRYRFIVKDEVTGISYIKHGFLDVTSPFEEGWVVTHNSNGKGHLGFIRTIDDKVFLSPIEDVNQKTYDEGVAAYTAGWIFNPDYFQIIYLTKSGAYRLDAQSFGQVTDNKNLFFDGGEMTFGSGAAYGYDGRGGRQVIFNGGNLYAANANDFFNGFNFSEKFSSRLSGDYEAFPFLFKLGAIGTTTAFYDNKNRTFKLIDETLAVTEFTSGSGLTGIGKKMVAADMGPAQELFCVLRDESTGKFHLFTFSGVASSYSSSVNMNQEMLNCPEIDNATSFTTSRTAKVIYYSAGNNVYLYDANANAAKIVYSFPAGHIIKDLEMLKETYKQVEYSSALHNKRLAAGVDNGTNGEVYFLDLNSMGEVINNTYSKKFTGFGQIVHLNVKSPY